MDEEKLAQAGAQEFKDQQRNGDENVAEPKETGPEITASKDSSEILDSSKKRRLTSSTDVGGEEDISAESNIAWHEDSIENKADRRGKEGLFDRYMHIQKKQDSLDNEDDASMIDKLRQAEKNMGMKFSESSFEHATFIINNGSAESQTQEKEIKNLLGAANRRELLEWCTKHYRDLHFSMLLSVCILDRQPYHVIDQMARELQKIILEASDEEETGKSGWNSKSQISEVLGIVEYTDFTEVRGVQMETNFLRLQVHDQAEQCIQVMVNEFSELKNTLTKYLINKIVAVYGSRHNFTVISGCIEALAFIGETDIRYFNEVIIWKFLHKKSAGMDFCLSMLFGKMYRKNRCRPFVITCIEQWGRLTNQPHCTLTALYVCSMFGKQEMLVCDIWMNVLDCIMDELLTESTENSTGSMSYFDILKELFESGNRNISYYKGVIHAFYKQILLAEKRHARERWSYLNVFFLTFLFDDYACCRVSGNASKRHDMVLVSIFIKLDEKTGKELSYLWGLALDNRMYPKEAWKILEAYLSEYEEYGDKEIEKLAFFFYHINQQVGRNKALLFLKKCAERRKQPVRIAKQIYRRIKE